MIKKFIDWIILLIRENSITYLNGFNILITDNDTEKKI